MPAPPKPFAPIPGLCLLLVFAAGCVTLDLREATSPYVGREKPGAPTIALVDVADRRDDPTRFGRAGYTVLSFSGDAGHKFRNSLISALDHNGYDVRYVGAKNVLDPDATAAAVREADADALLTAAVLELRLYSTDILFDPADVDFVAQVNLLDRDGRTVYTRHVHSRDDKRLWFNPGFGAMDMMDDVMDEAAAFVARDPELRSAMDAIRLSKQRGASGATAALPPAATLSPGERILLPAGEDTGPGRAGADVPREAGAESEDAGRAGTGSEAPLSSPGAVQGAVSGEGDAGSGSAEGTAPPEEPGRVPVYFKDLDEAPAYPAEPAAPDVGAREPGAPAGEDRP